MNWGRIFLNCTKSCNIRGRMPENLLKVMAGEAAAQTSKSRVCPGGAGREKGLPLKKSQVLKKLRRGADH